MPGTAGPGLTPGFVDPCSVPDVQSGAETPVPDEKDTVFRHPHRSARAAMPPSSAGSNFRLFVFFSIFIASVLPMEAVPKLKFWNSFLRFREKPGFWPVFPRDYFKTNQVLK
jgi:hypothetical protein